MNQTIKLLTSTEEELRKYRYALKERDFIISEQRKAGMIDYSTIDFLLFFIIFWCINITVGILQTENALADQACVLRSDLEKALQDNASLFQKIGM